MTVGLEANGRAKSDFSARLSVEAAYALHGFTIVVRTNAEALPTALDESLRYYRLSEPVGAGAILLDVVVEEPEEWDARVEALRGTGGCRFLGEVADGAGVFANFQLEGRRMIVRDPDILILAPGSGSSAEIYVTRERQGRGGGAGPLRRKITEEQVDWDTVADLVNGMAVGSSGASLIHAAALGTERGGILIAGNSGCGKTTTAAALTRAGAMLLSDDLCLARVRDGHPEMAGILMPMRFVGRVPASLATLEECLQLPASGPKPALALDERRLSGRLAWCTPKAIFLLEGTPGLTARHQVEALPATDACISLLRHVVDPMTRFRRREHLELAGRVTDACCAYRLTPGRDLASLPETLFAYL